MEIRRAVNLLFLGGQQHLVLSYCFYFLLHLLPKALELNKHQTARLELWEGRGAVLCLSTKEGIESTP